MILSVFALAVMALSTFLILSNLRMVLRDVVDVFVTSVQQLRFSDHIAANLALLALWFLLFALSFG